MKLRPNDFLNLRFELTKKYPGCPFQLGDVLEAYDFESGGGVYIIVNSGEYKIFPLEFTDHFKKLRWHDHRTLEQLLSIKYMKIVSGKSDYYVIGDTIEVLCFMYNNATVVGGRDCILFNLKGHFFNITQLEPATKEEHDIFLDRNKLK